MRNKKPTQGQIKEFWEWCGWGYMPGLGLISPEGEDYVPPIDLNNLFKYAVPKLVEITDKFRASATVGKAIAKAILDGKDPALALFWAIYRSITDLK